MPSEERDLADTAHDLGVALSTMAAPVLFRRGRILVFPDLIQSEDGLLRAALIKLEPSKGRTFFSDHIEFWKQKFTQDGQPKEVVVTLSKAEAEGLIESDQLLKHLPEILGIHSRPLPIMTGTTVRMLAAGYDTQSKIYTYPLP